MANQYDVIVVGSGSAGLYGAMNLPSDMKVLVLSKKELTLCNSSLAQGGIAGVYKPVDDDNPTKHKEDTFIAGKNKNNPETVDILVNHASDEIGKLIEIGVDFDKSENGDLDRTLEGGHSRRRIFHHKDATGAEIVKKLLAKVQTLPNVTIKDNSMMCGLKKTSTGFSVNVLRNDVYTAYHCHFLILATGGIGRIYAFTTNSSIATGDGIAFASRLGAKISNLSWIQFHPTAFNDHKTRECFLVSESVRGEGAYLLNNKKERFMHKYDERLELAPRDVVSHAIMQESKATGSDNFYLDIRYKGEKYLKERFPMIYENLLERGYDMSKDCIPIYPCQHYLMGGIAVDKNSMSTIENLYACGECSCTGVHGGNRLASNSLLEALVFSKQAALDIAKKRDSVPKDFEKAEFEIKSDAKHTPKGIKTSVRSILQKSYFVTTDLKQAEIGYKQIELLDKMLSEGEYLPIGDYVESASAVTCAKIILSEVLNGQTP
jgi:L-aspartate oxidase